MRVPDPEHHGRIEDSRAEPDGLGNQAASILALTLVLSGVSYVVLLQVIF